MCIYIYIYRERERDYEHGSRRRHGRQHRRRSGLRPDLAGGPPRSLDTTIKHHMISVVYIILCYMICYYVMCIYIYIYTHTYTYVLAYIYIYDVIHCRGVLKQRASKQNLVAIAVNQVVSPACEETVHLGFIRVQLLADNVLELDTHVTKHLLLMDSAHASAQCYPICGAALDA